MSANEPWTIDRIAHALPHSATRQKFLAEINLAPLGDLPAVLERWVRVAEDWTETGARIEALRKDPEARHALLADSVDITDEVVNQAARTRGAA